MNRYFDGVYTREEAYFETLPPPNIAEAAGGSSPYWNEWLSHPTYDDYWRSRGYEECRSRMTVSALNITGWWDMNFLYAPRNFVGMREQGATKEAREGQRLVIDPWPHGVNKSRTLSGSDFRANAVMGLDTYTSRFFDYWLRGIKDNALSDETRVRVFVVEANEWWEVDEWPLPGTQPPEFYVHSRGHANTHRDDGALSRQCPLDEPCDHYEADLQDPIRVLWNLREGPMDDRAIGARPDVLRYTTERLTEALDVVEPVKAVLYAASSARDCDWYVRLEDVDPDGTALFPCHGVLRSRFREGYERAVFLEPGLIECFKIDMRAAEVRFLPGHRIRVDIASSWFSRFERNPQTDAANWMTEERVPVIAQQQIFRSAQYAFYVSLL